MSLWAQNKLMPVLLSPNPGKLIQIFFKNFNFSSVDSDRFPKTHLQLKLPEMDKFSRNLSE